MIGPFGRQGPAATLRQHAFSSNDSKTLHLSVMSILQTMEGTPNMGPMHALTTLYCAGATCGRENILPNNVSVAHNFSASHHTRMHGARHAGSVSGNTNWVDFMPYPFCYI